MSPLGGCALVYALVGAVYALRGVYVAHRMLECPWERARIELHMSSAAGRAVTIDEFEHMNAWAYVTCAAIGFFIWPFALSYDVRHNFAITKAELLRLEKRRQYRRMAVAVDRLRKLETQFNRDGLNIAFTMTCDTYAALSEFCDGRAYCSSESYAVAWLLPCALASNDLCNGARCAEKCS